MTKKKAKPMKKPPIGVIPRYLWDEERLEAINDAIKQYWNAGMTPPIEWFHEREELESRYTDHIQSIIGLDFAAPTAEGSKPLFED